MPSSMSVTDGISVVIPMLDEQDNVAPLLDELHSTMNEHFEKYELIIVDDGSSDSTYAQLQSSQDSLPDLPLGVLQRGVVADHGCYPAQPHPVVGHSRTQQPSGHRH